MVLSPAREHIFFKIGALVQVVIPVLRQHASSTTTVNSYYEMVFSPAWEHRFCQNRCSRAGESHLWKWCSRLHESTCFSKCVLSPRRNAMSKQIVWLTVGKHHFSKQACRLGQIQRFTWMCCFVVAKHNVQRAAFKCNRSLAYQKP